MSTGQICVEVATGWTSAHAPRAVDTPAVADQPDLAAWLAALDSRELRQGLHGRTLTQLLRGEPVTVVDETGDWLQVVAPWQPAPEDPRGYSCWVRRAHVALGEGDAGRPPGAGVAADRTAIVGYAERFLGLGYLWGGTSLYGLDCSGLVHYCYRQAGVIVPRDAGAQQTAATPVPLGDEVPGDLYFFAYPGKGIHHVGFVTGRGRLLHAPESGAHIEDAVLTEARQATLAAAGRFLS